MLARVVNIRTSGYDVYIGRPGKGQPGPFGNPSKLRRKVEAIEEFREYFLRRVETDAAFREAALALRGKRLGCFCAPKACHGDVIAAWLNSQEPPTEDEALDGILAKIAD